MKNMLFAAAIAAAALGTQASAQQAQPMPPMGQMGATDHMNHMGRQMQGDRTRQQAQQMADQMFRRFDVNGDGVLTREEAQQALATAEAARGGDGQEGSGRAQRMLDRMFAGAPSVALAQFEAQALARFDRQDLNRDGVVTDAERQQGRANRTQ